MRALVALLMVSRTIPIVAALDREERNDGYTTSSLSAETWRICQIHQTLFHRDKGDRENGDATGSATAHSLRSIRNGNHPPALASVQCIDTDDFHAVYYVTFLGTSVVPSTGLFIQYSTAWLNRDGNTGSSNQLTVPYHIHPTLYTEDDVLVVTNSAEAATSSESISSSNHAVSSARPI